MQQLDATPTDMTAQISYPKPVIVLGGGAFDVRLLSQLVEKGHPLIAADGAADTARAAGIEVSAIIGDFDSIADPDVFSNDVTKLHLREQETTDFEKCLYSVDAPLFICFGMLGKRFDHSLAAIHAISRFGVKKNIVLVDQTDISLGVAGNFSIDLPIGERFSVFPLRDVHFERSTGLLYPLDDLCLRIGARIGTSNQVSQVPVEIKVKQQSTDEPYLVILPLPHLEKLITYFSV